MLKTLNSTPAWTSSRTRQLWRRLPATAATSCAEGNQKQPTHRAHLLRSSSLFGLTLAASVGLAPAVQAGTDLAGTNHAIVFIVSGGDGSAPYTNSGAGATLALEPNGGIVITEAAGAVTDSAGHTIAVDISGAGGQIIFQGANNYSGGTTIDAGTLTLGSVNAIGSGPLTVNNGGTLEAAVTTTITNAVTTNGTTTIEATAGQTLTLAGTGTNLITLNGTVHFGSATDTGTVVIAPVAAATTPAAVFIDGGTVQAGNALGSFMLSAPSLVVGTGSTTAVLDLNGQMGSPDNFSGNANGVVTNSAATLATLFPLLSSTQTFAGVIKDGAGPVALELGGNAGTALILTGANTYTGGTLILSGGTLQIGNGGTTGSIVGNVASGGILTFDRSDTYTFAGNISGTGALNQNGSGTTILTGANLYIGGTTINAGTLTLGSVGAIGSGPLTVNNGGTLEAAVTTTITNAVTTNGTTTIEAAAGQTLTLAGTGTNLITLNGTVHFGSATDTGTVVIAPVAVTSATHPTLVVDGGTLKVANTNVFNSLAGPTLIVGTGPTTATLDLNGQDWGTENFSGNANGVVTNSAASPAVLSPDNLTAQTFGGVIKDGAGTVELALGTSAPMILTGNNTYTGGTVVLGATLQIGNGGTTGSIVGNVTLQATLIFDRSDTYTFAGMLFGGGSLNQNGIGDLIVTGDNSHFVGPTTINAGTLTLGSVNAIGSGPLTVNNGGTLEAAVTTTITNAVTTNGTTTIEATAGQTLTLAGTGTNLITLNGTVHFGSATDTGTVVIAPVAAATTPAAVFIDGGTVQAGNALGSFMLSAPSLVVGTGSTTAVLDLNGQMGSPDNFSGNANGVVTNSAAALATLFPLLSSTQTFAGVIKDGAGPVALELGGNAGTALILTGANTYTGGTLILSGGTLQIGNGGTTGSIVGNVANGGILTFDRSDTYTFAGNISGTGALNQNGSGTTILTGANLYIGATTINAGTLEVDGSIANTSSVTVNAGGKLSGTGLVDPPLATTTIMSGGTLAPGNAASPTGTLTIGGNLAFQTGAFYFVQLAGTAASNTTVGGAATLAGTVQALVGAGVSRHSYDILHANGGLGGTTFNSLTLSNPNFGGNLSYTATDVFLNLTSAMLGSGTQLNTNQQNVANALNGFFNSGGMLPAAFSTLFGLTGAPLAAALTQLDGENATDAQKGAFQLMSDFLNLMLDPTGGGGGASGGGGTMNFAPEQDATLPSEIVSAYNAMLTKAPPKPVNFEQRWTAWGSAFGGTSHTSGDPVLGTTNVNASDFGFAGGMEYHLSPQTAYGFAVAGGGTNWSLNQNLGTGRSDAFQAGIYAKTHAGPAYLSAALAFANHWFTTDRNAALGDRLEAKFHGQSIGGRLEAGYRYAVQPMMGFTPYAAVQAQSFHTPTYTEADLTGGGLGLTFNEQTATDTRTELGARADDLTMLGVMPLILRGRLAWAHDWIGNPALTAAFQALPGASFIVNGAAPPKDNVLTTASAELRMTTNWSLLGKFDGEFGKGAQTYGGTGTLRYSW